MLWQTIATWTIVAAAAAYLAWRAYRTVARKKAGGCGTGCGTGCATGVKSRPLVTIEPLPDRGEKN